MGGKRQDMAELCEAIAKRGLLATTVQYRLAPAFRWPAMLDDVQAAVRYLRHNAAKYNIDPNRIGAAGASAGGQLSLLLGSLETQGKAEHFPGSSSRVSAVLNMFGPTDLSQDYPPYLDMMFETVLGKKKAEAAEIIRKASPVTHISKLSAPVFTIHGSADPLVPIMQSKRLDEALKKFGIFHDRREIAGMQHLIAKTNPECVAAVEAGLDFLVKHLTPEKMSL
jgi:acetyl esterase/lipase